MHIFFRDLCCKQEKKKKVDWKLYHKIKKQLKWFYGSAAYEI